MKKVIGFVVVAGGLSLLSVAPAHAAGQLCYDVNVNVNGTPLVQSGCQDIPDLPAAP